MKPIELKLTAFGPFANETTLNFKDDLANQQIFVISGPTGAGKTTIFDAMCYALYGKTSGNIREGKELRSDFVGPSGNPTEVEFTFEVNEKLYVIKRRPAQILLKKRGKDTKEYPAEQEFYDVENPKNVLTKAKEIDAVIEEVVGLTVDQFRKIVMIPQGDFKEFLLAKTTDKEELLRKIFGTDIFQQLQLALSEQEKELRKKVGTLNTEIEAKLNTFNISSETLALQLSDNITHEEKIQICESDLAHSKQLVLTKQTELMALKTELEQVEQALVVLKERESKFNELAQTKQDLTVLTEKAPSIELMRTSVAAAQLAREVRRVEEALEQKEQAHQESVKRKEATDVRVKSLESQFEVVLETVKTLPSLEQSLQQVKQERHNLVIMQQDVMQLDQQLTYVNLHEPKLELLKQQYETLEQTRVQLSQNRQPLDKLYEEQKTCNERQTQLQYELKQFDEKLEQIVSVGKVLRQIETISERMSLKEQQVIKQLATLEQAKQNEKQLYEQLINGAAVNLATHLQEEMPCPVCGSTHHPEIAKPSAYVPTEDDVNQAKQQVDLIQRECSSLERELEVDRQSKLMHEEDAAFRVKQLGLQVTKTLSLSNMLATHDQLKVQKKTIEAEYDQIAKVNEQCVKQIDAATKLERQLELMTSECKQVEVTFNEMSKQLEVEKRALTDLLTRIPEKYQSLTTLRQEQAQLQNKETTLEKQISEIRYAYETLSQEKSATLARLETEVEVMTNLLKEVEQAKQQFVTILSESFESLETYRNSILASSDIAAKSQEIKAFDEQLYARQERIQVLQHQLSGVARESLEPYELQLADVKLRKEGIDKEVAMIEATIHHNERLLNDVKKTYEQNKTLAKQYEMIGDLALLANGKSGNKMTFETYVLSSYFEDVLYFANQRLLKMTNKRYELMRREEVTGAGRKGLDLDVYDAHTAKSRPVSTLSGGESFKASLALALGLSDTVVHNAGGISLDTMFIDEGFGTLDSDSLEQAIEILMELQDNGRLIGVISHVEELKQRITAKLMVEASPSGSTAYFKR